MPEPDQGGETGLPGTQSMNQQLDQGTVVCCARMATDRQLLRENL